MEVCLRASYTYSVYVTLIKTEVITLIKLMIQLRIIIIPTHYVKYVFILIFKIMLYRQCCNMFGNWGNYMDWGTSQGKIKTE